LNTIAKWTSVVILFIILIINVANLWVREGFIVPNAKGQTTSDCPGSGIFSVTKNVHDPQGIAGGSLGSSTWTVSVNENGGPADSASFVGTSSSHNFCITPGVTISGLSEASNQGFTFTSQKQGQCTGTIQQGQIFNCIIDNTITGIAGSSATPFSSLVPGPNAPGSIVATPLSAPITPTEKLNNPPFQACQANKIGNTISALGNTAANDIVRAPSSQTITLKGNVPMDEVKNAMKSLGTNTFTLEFLQDLKPEDKILLAIANPGLTGRVLVESNDGLKQKVINFNVDTARTECKFVTLAMASGPAPNTNILPLGQLGQTKSGNIKAPDINKLLIGSGPIVTSGIKTSQSGQGLTGPFALALNPPFATCITGDTGDNVALYNIRGQVSDSELSKFDSVHSLTIEVTSDLVQTDVDSAKITNNNNPFIKVNLISNVDQNDVQQIKFDLNDLWTDCKQISQSTKSIFNALPGEIQP
jgi:hypothetical protein